MNGWLTKRANGLWLLTDKPPVIVAIGDSHILDAYPIPGDPIAFNNMCPHAVELIWGIDSTQYDRLQTIKVEVRGKVISHEPVSLPLAAH